MRFLRHPIQLAVYPVFALLLVAAIYFGSWTLFIEDLVWNEEYGSWTYVDPPYAEIASQVIATLYAIVLASAVVAAIASIWIFAQRFRYRGHALVPLASESRPFADVPHVGG